MSARRSRRRRWWLAGVGVLLVLAGLIVAGRFRHPRHTSAPVIGNRGENGLWLHYSWYFGQHSPREITELAARLRRAQVRYAYCHVRFITTHGRLHFRYPQQARRLVTALHTQAPGTRVLAWVFAGIGGPYHQVHLANTSVRTAMVQEAVWLVGTCGFDGVQWDAEVCRNGNADLLALLRETRTALPPGATQGVCGYPWYPAPATGVYGWDDAYIRRIAAASDQIAVMAYDSSMATPRAYAAFVRQQTVHFTQDAAGSNPSCRILIGVPTYGASGSTRIHNPQAETLPLAVQGVRAGLPDANAATFAGIAPFADYTTTAAQWDVYQTLWVGKP